VDAEPTYDFIPKNEIVRHMKLPDRTTLAGKHELISKVEAIKEANPPARSSRGA
jgi:hypothetical protein